MEARGRRRGGGGHSARRFASGEVAGRGVRGVPVPPCRRGYCCDGRRALPPLAGWCMRHLHVVRKVQILTIVALNQDNAFVAAAQHQCWQSSDRAKSPAQQAFRQSAALNPCCAASFDRLPEGILVRRRCEGESMSATIALKPTMLRATSVVASLVQASPDGRRNAAHRRNDQRQPWRQPRARRTAPPVFRSSRHMPRR